jgi:hypothetical protein
MPTSITSSGITFDDATTLTTGVVTAANIASGAVITAKINDAAVTPAKLSGAQSGSAPIYGARAWVNFDGTSTVTINGSGNVTSITDHGTGQYSINFATAMQDTSYCLVATARQEASTNQFVQIVNSATSATPLSTTSAQIIVVDTSPAARDTSIICAAIFR